MATRYTSADRDKAGKRYAAAVAELHVSLVELAALEGVVGGEDITLLTFAAWQPENFAEMRHRQFVPTLPDIREAVSARRAELIGAA